MESQSNNEIKINTQDSIALWILKSKEPQTVFKRKKELLEKAFSAARVVNNDSIKTKYLLEIAYELLKIKDSTLFLKVNRSTQYLALQGRDTFAIADTHWNFGAYYLENEILDTAYYHYKQAYDNFNLIDHSFFKAKMLYNMAIIQKDVKDYTGSEITIFKAIPIFKKLEKPLNLYYCYNLLGVLNSRFLEYDKAISYHNIALEYLSKIKNKRTFYELSLNNIGLLYQKQGNYKIAINYYNKALENKTLIKTDIYNYTRLIDNRSYSKFLNGDTVTVLNNFKRSLKIRDSLDYSSGIIISKLHLSEYFAKLKDTIMALSYANEASSLATSVGNNRDKLVALKLLSSLDKENAKFYLDAYIKLNDSLQAAERKLRNKFTRIRFETDEYIEETADLTKKNTQILVVGLVIITILTLLYFLKIQRSKNKQLVFEKEQQKSNEEIYSLLLKQQSKLEEGRLKERTRIAEELHDGILGKIFGTRLSFGFLNLKGDTETIKDHKKLIGELQEVEKEIRNMSHGLKSDLFSLNNNFSDLINDLVKKQSKLGAYKYSVKIDTNVDWNSIDSDIKMNCYRILQESLQNCNKHSKASFVQVGFNINEKSLILLFNDDGIGFDFKKSKKGIGLKNIKSRSHKIGAKFSISSNSNNGTIISVIIPI